MIFTIRSVRIHSEDNWTNNYYSIDIDIKIVTHR